MLLPKRSWELVWPAIHLGMRDAISLRAKRRSSRRNVDCVSVSTYIVGTMADRAAHRLVHGAHAQVEV